jgi:hypothetical protein
MVKDRVLKKYGVDATFHGTTSRINFIKNILIGSNVEGRGGGRHAGT